MFGLVLLACLPLTAAQISGPVDLSHPFDKKTIYAFGNLPFKFTKMVTLPDGMEYWASSNEFEAAEHGGTHIDAPYHFNKEGWKVDDIPFERFFGKAVYLNLRNKAKKNPDYGVSAKDFKRWEKLNGPIPYGAIVLLDFGWTEKYGNINEYLGTADASNSSSFRFPGLLESGAQWLVRTGKVFGIATDTVSLDVGYDTLFPAHLELTANNVYILEQAALPQVPLDARGYNIQALPMKIHNGTGAPCRLLAIPYVESISSECERCILYSYYLSVSSCSPALALPSLPGPVDLSHFYDENTTLYWTGVKPFAFLTMSSNTSDDGSWYAANSFESGEHGGTHMDAPYHFYKSGWQIGDIPLERLIGKAIYLNLREKSKADPDYQVLAEDFELWEGENGPMPNGAVVLLDFGWTQLYAKREEFFGTKDVKNSLSFHFPGLSTTGALWLASTGKVFGVATDTASIDYGQSSTFTAHKVLSANKIYVLEHVAYPEQPLPPTGYKLLSLPMKIRNGTGAPCRILALP